MGGLKILQNFALRGMGVTQLGIEPPLRVILSPIEIHTRGDMYFQLRYLQVTFWPTLYFTVIILNDTGNRCQIASVVDTRHTQQSQ